MAKFNRIKRIYDFYTSDLSYNEVEKLIKRDVPELYDFYVRRMKPVEKKKNSLSDLFAFIRNLIIEFLNLLSPIRRIIYSIAVILFILAYLGSNWQWIFIAFVLFNLLLAFELADKLIAKDELAVAREIQTALMPKEAPCLNHYEICSYSEAAREVGGDYFDFINHEHYPDKTYLIIGDISGKGMAAAIHMVQVQSILHHIIINHSSPKEILISLNRNLKKILRKGSFFTSSLASLNSDGKIILARAGHMPLLYYSKEKNECYNIIPKGIGIGLGNDSIFETTLEEITVTPEKGDILFFYTDGVVETMNLYKLEFGEERLKKIIKMNSEKPVNVIKEQILDSINFFKDSSPSHDDLTMIIMKAV